MKFFSRNSTRTADPVVERLVRRIAEDNAIDISDTKCSAMLAEAVQAACAYTRGMIDALGEPFVLDRKRATGSTLGPIIFDNRKDALDALRSSSKIRQVFTDPKVRECVFLLTMHRREYVIFGTEIEGEMVRRDVMQDAVEFLDHNFSAAAPSLAELRDILTENVVLFLADLAPELLRRDETMRGELHRSEELLKAQMQTLDYALRESGPFAAPPSLHSKISQGSQEMRSLLDRLSSLSAKWDPAKCLQEICDILLAPQNHVRLELVEMHVGDFGVKSKAGKFIRFHECVLGDKERLAVFMASMDRDNALYLWPDLEG